MASPATRTCAHCGLPTGATGDPPFCCTGCAAVYELLHAEGLDAFYSRLEEGSGRLTPVSAVAAVAPLGREEVAVVEEGGLATATVAVEGITCAACVWLLERGVGRLPGVTRFAVNFATHRARVEWDPATCDLATLDRRVRTLGYALRPARAVTGGRAAIGDLARLGVACFCAMNVMLLSVGLYAGYFQGMAPLVKRSLHLLNWGLATPVLFYSALPFWRGAWRGLRSRALTMDLLVCLGAGLAYGHSAAVTLAGRGETYFDSVVMIITLLLTGRFLEHRARARATSAVDRLASLLPAQARVWRASGWQEVAVAAVAVGDRMQVQAGERIGADGRVVAGTTEVDESMLTGESRPVARQIGARVTAGTLNLGAPIEIAVEAAGGTTRLAAIGRLLERAQADRPPAARLADRVASWFVVGVVGIALASYLYWRAHGRADPLLPSITCLIVACPCALGLATPVAVVAATTAATRHGILFKGATALELLGRVRRMLLDKTGTLTRGDLTLTEVVTTAGLASPAAAIAAAAPLATASRHPVARAIAATGRGPVAGEAAKRAAPGRKPSPKATVQDRPVRGVGRATTMREVPGCGVEATGGGRRGRLGRPAWALDPEPTVAERGVIDRWQGDGATVVALAAGGDRALFRLEDTVRDGAAAAMARLAAMGIETCMITGDAPATAATLAERLHLRAWEAGLSPEAKLARVIAARAAGPVAMVGDGINDAPALAAAGVGIALARGLDVAVAAADVLLLGDDLEALATAVALAQATRRTIRANYALAIAYNAITLPLAASGFMLPVFAAAAMAASSLTVTLNALRLLRPPSATGSDPG